jgi:hypothetical protein
MTYAEIQAAVFRALIDATVAVQTDIPRLVNQAILDIEGRFNFKAMQATQAYTTTAGSRTLTPSTIPADFKEYRGKAYYIEDLGSSREIDLISKESIVLRRWNTDDIGDPHQLVVDAGVLEVWPLPDGVSDYTDGEYRITLPYWKFLPALTDNSDTNWFTINAPQFIINWAASEGFALDWDEKRSDWWGSRAEKEALRTILQGKREYLSETDMLVPHLGALEAQTER